MSRVKQLLYLSFMSRVKMLRAWLRYQRDQHKYKVSRQWLDIGVQKTPEQVYSELQAFVKEVVGFSPRPYGHGAYGVILGAMWPPEEKPSKIDRWQVTFTYQDRQDFYRQLAERLAGWPEPPLALMVVILPYGAVLAGRPVKVN